MAFVIGFFIICFLWLILEVFSEEIFKGSVYFVKTGLHIGSNVLLILYCQYNLNNGIGAAVVLFYLFFSTIFFFKHITKEVGNV